MGDSTLLNAALPRLLLITDHARFAGEEFFVKAESALRGGVDAILVREKQMDSARLLVFCARLREMTRAHNAHLLVHTQADIAVAIGADGVHMAASGICEIPVIRRWLNKPEMSLSVSCHDADELKAAVTVGADFALLSPVFPTTSHPGAPHLGIKIFRKLAAASPLPVVALGGITPENRAKLTDSSVAAISAILDAEDPQLAARGLQLL